VVGPYEWFVASHYWMAVRVIEHVLQDTRFHLVDTSHRRGEDIDLGGIAQRTFGRGADPIVLLLDGPWLGRAGNRLVNHDHLRKLLDIGDPSAEKHFNVFIRPNRIGGVLCRYQGDETDRLRALTSPLDIPIYYWPHYIDPNEHRDWGLPKSYDVCVYGASNEAIYPLRVRLRRLLESGPNGLRVRIVQLDEGLRGARLSRVINQSWLTVADTAGATDRFVAKYVEIPLSGSGIVGNIPTRHRELFAGQVVEVTPHMSDQEMLAAIMDALADRDRLSRMTRSLRAEMLQRFTIERGREEFQTILRDFCRRPVAP